MTKKITLDSLLDEALALHNLNQFNEARSIYIQILKKDPINFDALQLLGNLEYQSKNYQKALKYLNTAIAIDNSIASVHNNLGNVLVELNLLQEASQSYNKAIDLNTEYAQAYLNRGNLLKKLNCIYEALQSYNQAINCNAGYSEAYSNRGVLYVETNQFMNALEDYNKSIELNQNNANAYLNRGNLYFKMNCFEQAIKEYTQALNINSSLAEAYSSRGLSLHNLYRFDEALENYEIAINMNQDYADAHLNKSLTLLTLGDYDRGFPEYEWRWKSPSFFVKENERIFSSPLWIGNATLLNKTILLWSEQGLGDCLQFCRYAKKVKSLGARILLEVPTQLLNILNNLDGVDLILEQGKKLPRYDFHCPLMTLPLALRIDLKTIPITLPYLKSSNQKTKFWHHKLGQKNRPRVGLVWSGNSQHKNDINRSVSLKLILDLLPPNIDYFSLQKNILEEERWELANSFMNNFYHEIEDFSDTAALCELMDLVISVDTSVAHLSGALGKETWLLLPYVADWRWLLYRNDSHWYPSIKLYRQGQDRKYLPVVELVVKDLIQKFLI